MRLCMSVCIAAQQRKDAPANEYLAISEKPVWAALRRLADVHPRLAHYTLRDACALEPCPESGAVVAWLREHRDRFAPVVEPDLAGPGKIIFDLSVGSPELAADAEAFGDLVFPRMRAAGCRVGVGRYNEPRQFYTAKQYETATDELGERRTVHVGVDLFLEAGSPVFAPLEGTVHSFGNNDAPRDYGPTIILQHQTGEAGEPFHTLYGHLSPDSLEGLQAGMPVAPGRKIGAIGEPSVNGGWPPHLGGQFPRGGGSWPARYLVEPVPRSEHHSGHTRRPVPRGGAER
jgi:hypothetical protein